MITVNHELPIPNPYPKAVSRSKKSFEFGTMVPEGRLVHNHPSGDPSPSRDDVAMTDEVRRAVETIGVVLHDHIIIGNGKWLSFRQEGLLR